MKNMFYTFSTVEEMVAFVNKAESCDFDVDICYNHLVIDGNRMPQHGIFPGIVNRKSSMSAEHSISKNDGRANDKPRFYLLNP